MLKLSEFWSARAHSEDFTLTRMGLMTVRLRLLTCLLMAGLPELGPGGLADPASHPVRGAVPGQDLLPAGPLAPHPLSYLIHFKRERMKLALGYLMAVMMLFSLICLHSFGADQEMQAGYMAFPYLLISLFAIFPIPLSLSLQLAGGHSGHHAGGQLVAGGPASLERCRPSTRSGCWGSLPSPAPGCSAASSTCCCNSIGNPPRTS